MKKLAYVGGMAVVSLLATSAVSFAKDEKAAAAPAAEKKAAAATPAAAQPAPAAKPEAAKPAAGAPAPKMEPAKPADAAAKPAAPPAGEAPKMEAPKPAPEIDAFYKSMQGTWKCSGTASMGGAAAPMDSTMSFKQDLDKFWIVGTFASKKSKTSPIVYKFTSYTTYDPATKKWQRLMVDNMGGWEQGSSAGLTNGQILWEGKGTGMGMSFTTKHTEQVVSPKEVKLSGQMSMDGKSWMPMYESTCKK